jgi:lipid-A-disaccharide synthase-like uncharacterized protein
MFEQITAFYNTDLGSFTLPWNGPSVALEIGKLIGYLGLALFTGRWFVQAYASKNAKRPVLPRLFWYMSLAGSLLTLSYFIFGKNDSVGILGQAFPAVLAAYNLFLDFTHQRNNGSAF